ncbi:MAG TPA: hypothetical protein VFP65_21810 [Anaeromyxobacteraceae bacterium]|nr:hypothetical protein [Anaeromyxobacteraceae bacterium]
MARTWLVVMGILFGVAGAARADDAEARKRAFQDLDRMRTQGEAARGGGNMVPGAAELSRDHRHLGFYFRPDLGFGFMSMSESSSFGDMKISGATGVFGLHIGGAIQENLILGFHLYDAVIVNPTIELNGVSQTFSDATAGLVGFGPELTYYFMPQNIYLSTTLALSKATIERNGTSGSTDTGFGARVSLGKEWWVSRHWGLGAVGHLDFASNKDGAAGTLQTLGASIAFSATYN